MEANYDEDLQRNSFFKEMQEKYVNIFNQAINDGWVICIPRSGSFNKTVFSENDFLNHILVPVQDSVGNDFKTLSHKMVQLRNKVLTIDYDIAKQCSLHVLFEEIFYTHEQKKYKVWCIERPFEQDSFSLSKVYNVTNLRECMDLLWTETSNKNIIKEMKSSLEEYAEQQRKHASDSLQSQRDSVGGLYAKCLWVYLKDQQVREKTTNCRYFLQLVKIAIETYVLYGLRSVLMRCVSTHAAFEDAALNKIIKNLSDLEVHDLGVREDLQELVSCGKFELSQIDKFDTVLGKVGCLKKTVSSLSSSGSGGSISSDDVLPVLIYLIIKSGVPNWIAQLTFMKQFRYSMSSIVESDEAQYLITTLEAAIEYIKSQGFTQKPVNKLNGDQTWQTSNDHINDKEVSLKYLFDQILNDDLRQVKKILTKTEKLVDNDGKLCHPLCVCKNCESNLARRSRLHWPTVNSRDDRGLTALHIACLCGHDSIVDFLISNEADVNAADAEGTVALHCACARGHQNSLLLLLHAQADPMLTDSRGNTPLHLAADHGHEGCVKAILYFTEQIRTKLNVNSMNVDGDTAMHHASKWGYSGIVEILLEYGADKTLRNRRGLSPLAVAHSSHVTRLLEKNDSLTSQPIMTIMSNNTSAKSSPTKKKIKKNVTFMQTTKESFKEKKVDKMLAAVAANDIHLVSFYLGLEGPCGNNFDSNETRCHPLCDCKKCASIDDKSILLEKKAETGINSCNERGESALHIASAMGHVDIVQLLLDAGANVNLQTIHEKKTPLHLACANDHVRVVRMLLECATCDVTARDVQGDTPLHQVVRDANSKLTEILVRHGANSKIKNARGESAIDLIEAIKDAFSDATVDNIFRFLKIGDG